MTDEYIAGFFDGEGMVRINKTKIKDTAYYSLQCVVVNTNITPLLSIQAKYGGTIAGRKKYKDNWNIAYRWRVTSKDAERFLKSIYPHLIIKKEQAQIGIDFQKHMSQKRYGNRFSKTPNSIFELRESFFERITVAKKRLKINVH